MKPLRLALDPILPSRTPTAGDCFEYGFRLRLPRGPALERTDPLLTAYGASVEWLEVEEHQEEALQADAFDPGRLVRLELEPFDPERPDGIGVWDVKSLHQAGTLAVSAAEVVAAAAEAGLEQRGLVLWEHRSGSDDRRERLMLLMHSPALVRVRISANLRVDRPVRPRRPRLVLVADGSGDLRWWDPSGSSGPLGAGDVGLSMELRGELERCARRLGTCEIVLEHITYRRRCPGLALVLRSTDDGSAVHRVVVRSSVEAAAIRIRTQLESQAEEGDSR